MCAHFTCWYHNCYVTVYNVYWLLQFQDVMDGWLYVVACLILGNLNRESVCTLGLSDIMVLYWRPRINTAWFVMSYFTHVTPSIHSTLINQRYLSVGAISDQIMSMEINHTVSIWTRTAFPNNPSYGYLSTQVVTMVYGAHVFWIAYMDIGYFVWICEYATAYLSLTQCLLDQMSTSNQPSIYKFSFQSFNSSLVQKTTHFYQHCQIK